MIPIMQTKAHPERGDCLRACIASLLHLSIDQVPNFMDIGTVNDSLWFTDSEKGLYVFLLRHGYEYLGTQPPRKALELSKGIDGYFMASVKSVNFPNKFHAVIFNGLELAHDPSNIKKWEGTIDDVEYFDLIEKKEK